MDKNLEIDNTDIQILAELMKDAKTPYTEIAEKINVSGGTVHVRMKKLGYDITAFLGIYLQKSSLYEPVSEELSKIPEILSLHYTTGAYSIFARIICKNTSHLLDVLHNKIQRVNGIERTETFITLEEKLNRPLQLDMNLFR
jgi:Lrp/AsnC family transcriptional regulator for asnA, asnC and gidA